MADSKVSGSVLAQQPALQQWKTVDVSSKLKIGRWLDVQEHKLEISPPATSEAGSSSAAAAEPKKLDWCFLSTPSFVNVAVRTADKGEWLLFHQTKYGVARMLGGVSSLAPVGGLLDAGEDALTAAKRETLEELGYTAADEDWHSLGSMVADANRGNGVGSLFFCNNAVPAARKAESDDLEEQILLRLSTEQLQAALLAGDFKVHSWAACLSLALLKAQQLERS